LQVVTSPCCPRQLPDVISNSLFLDAGSPTPAVHRVLAPVSSTVPSAFPRGKVGRLPAAVPLETTSCGGTFEVADISLRSGLQVCSPPRSSLPLRILPQGSRGFYVRAERGSLPPRASDMLTARRQAIGGTGTCTPLDCGLVGCSFPRSPLSFRTVSLPGRRGGYPPRPPQIRTRRFPASGSSRERFVPASVAVGDPGCWQCVAVEERVEAFPCERLSARSTGEPLVPDLRDLVAIIL
jgi:hypothetical protein